MESGYRLRKELFAFEGNKVRFICSGVGDSTLTWPMMCGFGWGGCGGCGERESEGGGPIAEKGR